MDENVNDQILKKEMKVINAQLVESFQSYRKLMSYMATDIPIGILGLPKPIETTLINAGCLRVYDLLDRNLAEIKGIGRKRLGLLTTCLNNFIAMC